ncbi:MAG: CopG family transcriptional regulator [Candidatus Aminicenantales bacterium]
MSETTKRSTIYFKPELHRALRIKAIDTQRSLSDLVNDAVQMALREDEEDLSAFDERASEPTLTYEELLRDLKAHGKI